MKMFIPVLCFLSFVFAEPPVDDNYAAAGRSSHDHNTDFQRSLALEYGVPPQVFGSRDSLSTEYGPPKPKPSALLSQKYGLPSSRISQEYGTPNTRISQYDISRISQEYGLPNPRSTPSQEYGAPNGRSNTPIQDYKVPKSRSSLPQEYKIPSSRNGLSQEYGAPNVRKTQSQDFSRNSFTSHNPSSQYGEPHFHAPSEKYGHPQKSSSLGRTSQKQSPFSNTQHQSLSQEYGAPSTRTNDISQSYSALKNNFKSSSRSSQSYGAQKSSLSQGFGDRKSGLSQSLSTSYGVPSADSYSQGFGSDSLTYDGSNQRDLSETYGVPTARGLSQEYGVPDKTADLKTNAVISSYSSPRSSPSSVYGVPSARDATPLDQYGLPEQYNALSNQGYEYARGTLDDQKQEPANYDFAYKVNDYITGSDFGHSESRLDNRAEGTYFVVLPDGTKQVVEYEADERGFKPRISVEPADITRSGGYDDNAGDLVRSDDGPY